LNALDLARTGKAESYVTERQRERQMRRQKLRGSHSVHTEQKFFQPSP
jgi:hypothetical protein